MKKSMIGYIVVLALLLLCGLGAYFYSVRRSLVRDQYNAMPAIASSETGREASENEGAATSTVAGFYGKLSRGEAVRILLLGDSSAQDPEEKGWPSLLREQLMEHFGSEVTLVNQSAAESQDALYHYTAMQKALDAESYDAVLLSMGYYEDPFRFPLYYEAMLRSLKLRSPETAIIALIESAAVSNTWGSADELATVMRKLTEEYGGLTISFAEAFATAGEDYSSLSVDALHYTEKGQQLLANWAMRKLSEAAADERSIPTEAVALQNAATAVLDRYSYLPAGEFRRITDTDYRILNADMTALGAETVGTVCADYDLLPGRNDMNISIDGQLYGGYGADREDTAPMPIVQIINNNANVTQNLTVSFATKEEADTFRGVILFGNLSFLSGNDGYRELPIPPEEIAETEAETETVPEETTAAETEKREETRRETRRETEAARQPETAAPETTEAVPETREEATETVETAQETEPETTEAVPETVEAATEAETEAETAETAEAVVTGPADLPSQGITTTEETGGPGV